VPRGHQPADTPELLDHVATDLTLELALALVDAIDADPACAAAAASGTIVTQA
jgi:hypothetical protein